MTSAGATYVIKVISERRNVEHVVLNYNPLGDEGCEMLFSWLCSPAGKRYKIQRLSLVACNIGDRGLVAIGQYLRGNVDLKELWLQQVSIAGRDPSCID